MNDAEVFKTLGTDGFTRLVAAFYRRIRTDDILGPLYPPGDFEAAEVRLRLFLIQRFGGPGDYSAARGHPRLRMRHVPFAIGLKAASRWLNIMDSSLIEVNVQPEVRAVLWPYFEQTAEHMINTADSPAAAEPARQS